MENSTITFITDQLKQLTSIPSPTGFTKEVTQYLVSTLEAMGYTPERSRKGNILVTIGGEGSPLILAAHVDTWVHGALHQKQRPSASDDPWRTSVEHRRR